MTQINRITKKYQMPIFYSMHSRSKKFIEQRRITYHPLVHNISSFGLIDYSHLQMNGYCVLSDSGTLSEESAMLRFPGLLIRSSTERLEVIDKGSVVIVEIKGKDVEQAESLLLQCMRIMRRKL